MTEQFLISLLIVSAEMYIPPTYCFLSPDLGLGEDKYSSELEYLTLFGRLTSETVHRRSHTHSKPSGKRAPMVANGLLMKKNCVL
ncbi:hypothetical protein J6590_020179 [Homalodisca vitripennis]|nr:hypothetical protein J6590_020179 [Homalodisca vitripennis]